MTAVKFFLPHPDQQVIQMLKRNGFEWCTKQDDADIVVFTGGADVHPALYGERRHATTTTSGVRDNRDIIAWNACRQDQLKVGICRGAQFLNVMNGGKLYQNVTNHAIHGMHWMYAVGNQKGILVTSTHHQMMIPSAKASVLFVANIAMKKEEYGKVKVYTADERKARFDDVEVCVYKDTKSLCYQPHPEYDKGNKDNERLFIELVLEMMAYGEVRSASGAILSSERSQKSEETGSSVRH